MGARPHRAQEAHWRLLPSKVQFQQPARYRAGGPPLSLVFEKLAMCLFKWVFSGLCTVQVYIEKDKIKRIFLKKAGGKSSTSRVWEGDREDSPLVEVVFSGFKVPQGCLLAELGREGRSRSSF